MGYNCVVCVKQVPDTKNITGEAMKDDGTVNRAALPAIFNPEDKHALETALEIKDRYGGTVTVVTMGLPKACDVLRESLYLGADRAMLITDRRAAGSDTLATSYILSCAARKLKPDMVLCGRQAIDGDTAQVGPQMAEKLDFTLITCLEELQKIDDRRITIRRNVGNGWEIVTANLPVVVTVSDTANTPRPPAAKRMMKLKKARSSTEIEQDIKAANPEISDDALNEKASSRVREMFEMGLLIEQVSLDEIDADLDWCGLSGSPTKVHRVQSIVLAGGEYHEFAASDEGVTEMVAELVRDHTLG